MIFGREGASKNPIPIGFIPIDMSIGMNIYAVGFGLISLEAIRR